MGLINLNNISYLIINGIVLQYCQFQWQKKKCTQDISNVHTN